MLLDGSEGEVVSSALEGVLNVTSDVMGYAIDVPSANEEGGCTGVACLSRWYTPGRGIAEDWGM